MPKYRLSTTDHSYQYKGNQYFAEILANNPIDSDNRTYKVELTTSQFDPIIFIMTADGSKVLHTGKDAVSDGSSKTVSVQFTANSGQSVLISVETRNPQQIGSYTVSITKLD